MFWLKYSWAAHFSHYNYKAKTYFQVLVLERLESQSLRQCEADAVTNLISRWIAAEFPCGFWSSPFPYHPLFSCTQRSHQVYSLSLLAGIQWLNLCVLVSYAFATWFFFLFPVESDIKIFVCSLSSEVLPCTLHSVTAGTLSSSQGGWGQVEGCAYDCTLK